MKSHIIIRQGDVLLEPIATLTAAFDAAPLDRDGSATIAHGEATGHRHRFERQAMDDGSALSMIAAHPAARHEIARGKLATDQVLLHEEHFPQEVPAGIWRVSRPYEYIAPDLIRQVAD